MGPMLMIETDRQSQWQTIMYVSNAERMAWCLQNLALSPTELGTILSANANAEVPYWTAAHSPWKSSDASQLPSCSSIAAAFRHTHLQVAIYHDPGKGTNTEGQTIKQLKIQPTPDGKVSSL